MKAIIIKEQGKAELVSDKAVPKLRPSYVQVKTEAVALNPTDWKHIDFIGIPGCFVGCDVSGTVEESNGSRFQKGDRVLGLTHGSNTSNHEDGGFGEHVVIKEGVMAKIPEGMSFEEAAAFPVGVTTIGQGLYQSLKLPPPDKPATTPIPVLIYGGSTASGIIAIQYAKLSGLTVVATCSPHNNDLCKSLGADAVFDYNSPDCAEQIRAYTKDSLHHAFDCIASESTGAICCAALSSSSSTPNHYSALLPVKTLPREDVSNAYTMGYTGIGERYEKRGTVTEAKPEDYEFQTKWWALFERLVAEGKIRPHPVKVGKDGLKGVLDGLQQMREDKVSGVKLVYRVADTP